MSPRWGAALIGLLATGAAFAAMWTGLAVAVNGRVSAGAEPNPAGFLLPLIGLVTYHGGLLVGRLQPSPVFVWLLGPLVLYGSVVVLVWTRGGFAPGDSPALIVIFATWVFLGVCVAVHAQNRKNRPLR